MKTKLLLICLNVAFIVRGLSQDTPDKLNLSLDQFDNKNQFPLGWRLWPQSGTFSKDTLVKTNGPFSVRIDSDKKISASITRLIPSEYEGERITLRADIKLSDVRQGFAGLMLRIDDADTTLAFENMLSKRVSGTSDWKQYSVSVPLSEKAKKITVGALLTGSGTMWVDNFQLFIDDKPLSAVPQKAKQSFKAELDTEFTSSSKVVIGNVSKINVDNLASLARVWGFVKYYHPQVARGNYNWDFELFRMIPKIVNCKTSQNRNKVLFQWVLSLGGINSLAVVTRVDSSRVKLFEDVDWITEAYLGKDLFALLGRIKAAKRHHEHFYIELQKQVKNPMFKNENSYKQMHYPDTGYRLLSLFRYWNIIQYYFPYRYLIDEDWNDVLPEYIPKFIDAKNELDYKLLVLELTVRIRDTHAIFSDKTIADRKGKFTLPISLGFIEDKAIVLDYPLKELSERTGLRKGDRVIGINGESVELMIKNTLPYTPGSNYAAQLRNLAREVIRSPDSIMEIKFQRDDEIRTCLVAGYRRSVLQKMFEQKKDTCCSLINNEIAYINPGYINNAYVPEIMSRFDKTKGLVIDLRYYPSDFIVFTLGAYLVSEPTSFVKFAKANFTNPGRFDYTPGMKITPNVGKEAYQGKIIILINENTQSSGEYTAMAFQAAERSVVIGSTTAGADGSVSEFSLPGGIRTHMSGTGVYYPDGRETQRIGIIPDIEIKPTIEGVRKGKDELLEKAIEVINQ